MMFLLDLHIKQVKSTESFCCMPEPTTLFPRYPNYNTVCLRKGGGKTIKIPPSLLGTRESGKGVRGIGKEFKFQTAPIFVVVLVLLLIQSTALSYAQADPEVTRGVSAALGLQGRLMWVDGSANVFRKITKNGVVTQEDYTTTRAGVEDIVQHCKSAHFNTIVVDIKPLSGEVLFSSKIAPRMKLWKGRKLPDFDVLAAFVEIGHREGLKIDACINTLSEGHKYYSVGPAYNHPEWQSIVYTVDRGLNSEDGQRLPVRAIGEPDDITKPTILTDDSVLLGGDPTSGLVGLESAEKSGSLVHGDSGIPLGKQLNISVDVNNRVTGVIDSALLGEDPLLAPEDGRLITAARTADQVWVGEHLRPGSLVRFDLRSKLIPIATAPSEKIACFVNPLNPEARKYELDIVKELVTNYEIDALVLDRCRFSNINNDFSELTRDSFRTWLRSKPRYSARTDFRWPEDIFSFSPTPGAPRIEGALYKPWLEFRATVIRDLVADIARTARTAKPNITLGTYVGSWYPKYYEVGVNWGSEQTRLRYPWFTPDYPQTGYADYFDWISTGCYYQVASKEDARTQGLSEKGTVEYAAQLSGLAVANSAFVYPGIYCADYTDRPEVFIRAIEAAFRQGQGCMVFDLSYINDYNWWPILENAALPITAPPDSVPNLLSALRSAQAESR